MAAGNDTVNIKVKYIPDTSALKNIKEIRMPEIKVGGTDAGKGVFDSYNNAIRDLNRELSKGTDASAITKAFKTVGEETTKVKTQINSMKEAINQSFQSPSNQSLIKDYQNLEKQLKKLDAESQKRRKKSAELSSFKSQNNMSTPQARKEISKAEALVTAGEKLTKQDQERLEIAKQIIAKEEELAKLRTQEEIRNAQKDIKNQMSDSKYDSMISSTEANRILGQYNDILSRVGINLNSVTGESKKFSSSLDEQVNQVKAAKKEVVKFGDIVSGTFLGTSLSNLFQTGLSRGIEFFKDYDETLTRTMMVTGQTREEVNSLTSSYNKLANQLSSTTKDVAAAQLVFYQQGLGTSEALKMTEASIAVSKTGGIGAAEAADRLTAAVRGYQLSANEAMGIADKMSALDAAAASSVDELTVAMQKSASQARMAGLDLDYYMAYLSTMQEVTREAPENIGTAMKSITSRLQEIKDIGKIEEDGTTFSNVAKALTSIGIAATDSSGQLRTLQDIMNELGPMWNTLDRNHKAYIATVLAGNRQQSRFIALMDNYDRAMELVDVSQNASGESAKQLRAYNQGLEASFTRLSNAWQQFATNIADSSMIKRIIDMFSSFIELLNKIPKGITSTVVPLLALTKVFTTLSKAGNLFKGFKTWSIEKLGLKDTLKDIGALGNSFQEVGKKANLAWSSVKKFIDGFGNNKYIEETTKKTKDFTTAKEMSTAAQINSNSAQITEAGLNTDIALSAEGAANAYKIYNEELFKNATALAGNDIDQTNEIKQNLEKMTSDIAGIDKEIEDVDKLMDEKVKQIDKKKRRNISEELVSASPNKRRSEAEKYLRSKSSADSTETIQDLLANNKKNTQKLTKDTQKDLLNFAIDNHDDIVKFLKEENKSAIKQMTEEFDDLSDRYGKLLETRQNKVSEFEQYSTNIESSPFYQKALSKYNLNQINQKSTLSLPDMKTVLGDKNLGNIEKFTAFTNKLNIGVGLVVGSLTKMGASFLGLDDDMSSALSTSVGLATSFAKFAPPWGAIIGASIGGVKLVFDKLWPSVEKTQEKLAQLQQKQDEVGQQMTDMRSSLDVYEKLSGKLDKTEEETQQLKDSTERLIELVPGAVAGYNQYGEAVLNTAKAYEELDKKQREASALSTKSLKEFDNLQKGAQKTEKTIKTIADVVIYSASVLAAPITSGLSLLAIPAQAVADVAWNAKISEEQIEENKKVWDENYSEILSNYQTKRDEFLLDVSETNKDTASKIVDSFIASIIEAGREGRISDASKALESTLEDLGKVSWSVVEVAMERLTARNGIKEMNFGKARKFVEEELKDSLKAAGLDEVEIRGVITAVLNIEFNGAAEVEQLKKNIDTEISNLRASGGRQEKIDALGNFKGELDSLNQSEIELLKNAGMLDVAFAEVFENNGGVKKTLSSFKMQNGELNKQKAIISSINSMLNETSDKEKEIQDYEKKNKEERKQFQETTREYIPKIMNFSDAENEKYVQEKVDELEKRYKKLYDKGITSDPLKGRPDYNANGFDLEKGYDTDGANGKFVNDDAFKKGFEAYVQYRKAQEENDKIINELTKDNAKFADSIKEMVSKIESYAVPTFDELSSKIEEMKTSWDAFYGLADKLDSTDGVLDADGLIQLFDLLGSFEDAAFESQEQFDGWMHAIQAVNNGLSQQNGQLVMNEEAMGGINDLISYSTKLKANDMLMSIEQGRVELENQKSVLEAQKAAVDAEIIALKAMSDAEYKKAMEKGEIQETLKTSYIDLLDKTNMAEIEAEDNKFSTLVTMTGNYYKQIAAMRTAYANGEDIGDVSWIDIKGKYSKVYEKFVEESSNAMTSLISSNRQETIDSLQKYSDQLGASISNLDQRINNEVKLKKTVAEFLASDSANLGKTFDDASKSASDYNEKLERTLTLLEKIEGLQHKIDENETFKDLYDGYSGEDYGRLLMSNLDLAQQQYEVYKDLFAMQQEMTNQAAGDLLDSPYGQMFKIMENGDIGWADTSMYDKYKNMPADMKEDIDNLVEAFQKQRDALRNTEKDMSKYAQEVKKVREELVQMQIEIENELVDAIKNREKILHDARVKALDDEIDMIEKAVEARKKAQEDDNSNKELYKAQEALRRATLDSSGKNNAQLLQLQQDLEDKQLEIAEKRFEDDMDDRKQWLQDTKDAETETYDYRLEKMTWYWEQVQAIQEAGTEAMMETLIHWNIEYAQTSEYQQGEMERKWKETMDAMKAATDMGAELGKMTSDIVSVTQTVEAMDIKIQALPGSWQKATDAVNSYAAAASRVSSYKPSSSLITTDTTDTTETNNNNNYDTTSNDGTKMKKGDKIEFRPASNRTAKVVVYDENGGSVGTYQNGWGDKNGKAGEIKTIRGVRMVYFSPAGGYIETRHFQKQGTWGASERYYRSGGMVDYTGPAWVDGNKTHPEAFLSAYQTEQIGALAKSLDPSTVNNATTNSNITFGSINFNVASMSSATDGKKALDIFVQGANDMMAKKGIGTKLNINMK
jgi:TP901 family phage tail tape measure protein